MAMKRRKGQRGASMVEYAILLALLLLFVLATIRAMGSNIAEKFSTFASDIS